MNGVPLSFPFGKFLRIAMVEYIRECGGRDKITSEMTETFIERAHEEWHAARKLKKERATFTPPTPEQVEAYSQEIRYPLDGVGWCLHYEVKGWHTGNAKMRNWKAAVRNWKRNGWHTKITPGRPEPIYPEPAGWFAFMCREYPDSIYVREWFQDGKTDAPKWATLYTSTKKTITDLMNKENPSDAGQ